ncbi:serine hydrolase [Streptomyces sp. bgisy029]|uniref:D-alanyl-D-alanine carboxypeptidase family protein n=1 Tax=Streptomyces sp. bgisy029 TaxID=3413771 RepID=UPI003D71017A
MAGESPDKTEQRKSSGTAAEERDPRFAVFREPGGDVDVDEAADADAAAAVDEVTPEAAKSDTAKSDTAKSDTAKSDTATAVFRPRLPEDEAGAAGSRGSSASRGSSDSHEEGPEEASEGAVTPQKPAQGSAEGSGGVKGPEGPSAAAGAAEGDADGTAGAAAEEPEAGDVRLRAAVAAWVDAAAEDEGKAEDKVEGSSKGEVKGESAVDADAAAEAAAEPEPEPGAVAAPEAGREPEAEAAAEPAPADDTEPAADSEAEPEAGAELKPVEEPEAEPKAAAATEADKPESATDPEPEPGTDSADTTSDLRGIDQPTAVFKAVAPAGRVDQPTTALKLSPQELQALKAAGDKARGESESAAQPKQDKPEQDEPEQEKSAQDKRDEQDRRDEQDKAEAKPEQDKPETAAERTSTFVPLRSDDVRPALAPGASKPETATGTPAGKQEATPPTQATAPTPAAPSWAAAERTRQQPLPPKPPLDLLAELTNTPPPAETPVRTAVRRVKIWTPLLLLLLIVFAIAQVMRPLPDPALELTAKPTYTFEGGETKLSWPGQGQSAVMVDGVGSLGSEGAQKPAPIASVAKAMTAYVILQEHPLKGDEVGETITADQQAEDESKNEDESVAQLTNGQKLSQLQLLQLLMIPSGNNAARLLARWDSGSEDKFVDKMNDAAKDLGMTDSTYTDPSGLKKTTVSTATDQLKLAQAVMRSEVFRKIVDMPDIEIEGMPGKIYNNNTLLLQPGVSGIKTGSSTPAGGNLLWSANTVVDGKTLWIYGAVMGQQAGTGGVHDSLELSLANSLKLIKDAQKAPTSATVVKKGDVVGYVDNGFGARTPVIATKNLKAVGWPGLQVELKVTDSGKGIAHSAKAGSEVGMVTVGTGTGKVTAPVVLQDDLTEPAFGDKLTRIG